MKSEIKSGVPKASADVVIGEKSVTKFFGKAFELEKLVSKHESMASLLTSNGIITPEVLAVDSELYSIEFSKLPLAENMGKNLQNSVNRRHPVAQDLDLYVNVGKTLGLIHRDLKLKSKTESDSRHGLAESDNEVMTDQSSDVAYNWKVFQHGDFSLNNLFVVDGKLAVIDPVPNQTTMFHIDEFGSNAIEVSYFCNSVLRQLSFKHYRRENIQYLSSLIDHFFIGYEAVTGRRVCRARLRKHIIETDKCVANKRLTSNVIKLFRSLVMKPLITKTIR